MKYIKERAGPDGWSRWVKPIRRGYKMACCDCGLVHNMDFKVVQRGNGTLIFFRAQRNNRSTAMMRRHDKAKP